MAAIGDVDSIIEIYEAGQRVSGIDTQTFQNVITTSLNDIDIAASGVNVVIPVGNKGTIKELKIFTDYTTTDYLTCKINGQSTVWTINPFQIFTQNITSLTVSNSDADNGRVVNVEITSVE